MKTESVKVLNTIRGGALNMYSITFGVPYFL